MICVCDVLCDVPVGCVFDACVILCEISVCVTGTSVLARVKSLSPLWLGNQTKHRGGNVTRACMHFVIHTNARFFGVSICASFFPVTVWFNLKLLIQLQVGAGASHLLQALKRSSGGGKIKCLPLEGVFLNSFVCLVHATRQLYSYTDNTHEIVLPARIAVVPGPQPTLGSQTRVRAVREERGFRTVAQSPGPVGNLIKLPF